MNKKRSADADKLLERLAVSSPNDAVKLLYLGAEDISELEGLDLSLLSEIKRGPKGEVELKFVNKLALGQDPVHGHILCLLGHAPV